VDESHRIGGSSEQVARHQLGRGLSEASPYLLLLSATPHQGKTDAFHRLVSLLDKNDFPEPGSVTRERIHPYVIRTEKRQAITPTAIRCSSRESPSWSSSVGGAPDQKQLTTRSPNTARRQQPGQREKRATRLFDDLMQRLVTIHPRIIPTLEKRLAVHP